MEVIYKGMLVLIFLVIDYRVFPVIFKALFPNKGDFAETVRVGFRPDIISLFKGEYWKDQACEFMLSFMMLIFGGIIFLEVVLGKFILAKCGF